MIRGLLCAAAIVLAGNFVVGEAIGAVVQVRIALAAAR